MQNIYFASHSPMPHHNWSCHFHIYLATHAGALHFQRLDCSVIIIHMSPITHKSKKKLVQL